MFLIFQFELKVNMADNFLLFIAWLHFPERLD